MRSQLVRRQPKRWESLTGKLHRPRTLDGRIKVSNRAAADGNPRTNETQHRPSNPAPEAELSLTGNSDLNNSNSNSNDINESELTPEQEHRRQALKSMLAASNARYQQAVRKRGPVFAAGIQVKIKTPSLYGTIAVVLDADYIESRALLSVPNQDEPLWLPFTDLGLPD